MEVVYTEREITEKKIASNSSSTSNSKRNKYLKVFSIILGIVVVIVVFLIVYYSSKKSKSNNNNDTEEIIQVDNSENIIDEDSINSQEEEPKPIDLKEDFSLEKEFEILTKEGLRKFNVVQNSVEENKINGNLITTKIKRITN